MSIFMILKKISAGLFAMCLLSGCVQGTALLGPVYTLANTGNVYQASISYGSNKAVKKITGKTTSENIKDLIENDKKNIEEENYEQFFALVKRRVEKTNKIINSINK